MKSSTNAIQIRKAVFKANLRQLTGFIGKSFKEVANESGLGRVGYRWLRRAVSMGIHGPAAANHVYLERLVRYFGPRFHFREVSDFWDENLIQRAMHKEVEQKSSVYLPDDEVIRMFKELLETKEFSYLKVLIADLYRLSSAGELRPTEDGK